MDYVTTVLRKIYPLYIREWISWRVQKYCHNLKEKNVRLEFNSKVFLDLCKHDIGHKSIILNGFYELMLTRELIKKGQEMRVMFDVGSNYGYFSCLWASLNINNKVYAFEASPENIRPLYHNILKNNLSDKITVIPVAVGKNLGTHKFNAERNENQTGWGGLSFDNSTDSLEVDMITLDKYADDNSIEQIDVLKIDTEGADTWVLYGAKNLLKNKKIKHIFYEQNFDRMKLLNIKTDDALLFLESYNYKVRSVSATDFYAFPDTDLSY